MRQKTILYGLLAILLIIFIFSGLLYIDERKDDPVISTSIKVPETPSELTIFSYNINHGVDRSGKCNLDRIVSLINEKGADIAGFNEVDKRMLRTTFKDQARIISEKTGMNYVFAPNLKRFTGTYGNALLSRFPILKAENHKLPQIKNNEARGLLDATLLLPDNQKLRVLVTHLSVKSPERVLQLAWLENYIKKIEEPFFLLGDFNQEIETLLELEPLIDNIKTYPANKPENHIDHIFSNINIPSYQGAVIFSQASDHLPLWFTTEGDKLFKH